MPGCFVKLPVSTSTVGQKCVHVFLLPAIRSVVIPGEDLESRVRFDTLDSRFRGNDIEGIYGLSPQCTCSECDQHNMRLFGLRDLHSQEKGSMSVSRRFWKLRRNLKPTLSDSS